MASPTNSRPIGRTDPMGRAGRWVTIPVGTKYLQGDLVIPRGARGLVLFAHGSGSCRHSPRNRLVALELRKAGLATLLMDLLTDDEERAGDRAQYRFDIGLLADRLLTASRWVHAQPETADFPVGYFGASTGAAAALVAAARSPRHVSAVVSRGGRPDLAGGILPSVEAPTLLIVGGEDFEVIGLNRQAYDQLRCQKQLVIVPGASHLFEEAGALEEVARLARSWFERFLRVPTADTPASTGTR